MNEVLKYDKKSAHTECLRAVIGWWHHGVFSRSRGGVLAKGVMPGFAGDFFRIAISVGQDPRFRVSFPS